MNEPQHYHVEFVATIAHDHREHETSTLLLRHGLKPNLVIDEQYFPFEIVGDEGAIAFGKTGTITGKAITTADLVDFFAVGAAIELRSGAKPLASGKISRIVSQVAV